jgi:hypothetical protein
MLQQREKQDVRMDLKERGGVTLGKLVFCVKRKLVAEWENKINCKTMGMRFPHPQAPTLSRSDFYSS